MAADIYKRKGVVTGKKKKSNGTTFIVLTIFQIVFHNSNLQSTKHHKLSPAN